MTNAERFTSLEKIKHIKSVERAIQKMVDAHFILYMLDHAEPPVELAYRGLKNILSELGGAADLELFVLDDYLADELRREAK